MPAASVILSPTNQNPALHRPHSEPGARKGGSGDHTSLRLVFCFSDLLPRKGQSSKHVELSDQLFLVASLVTTHQVVVSGGIKLGIWRGWGSVCGKYKKRPLPSGTLSFSA